MQRTSIAAFYRRLSICMNDHYLNVFRVIVNVLPRFFFVVKGDLTFLSLKVVPYT